MFDLIKPINEIKKTLPIIAEKTLDNNLQGRKSPQHINTQIEAPRHYTITEVELQTALDSTNRIIFGEDNRFEFRIHERTNRIMVKLVNNHTEEVIKELPPEKILDLVASIWDLVGILVDERG